MIDHDKLKKMYEALGELWTPEFGEIELEVHHTLTEPTCPVAIVSCDGAGPLFRYDADTIEEAIHGAVTAAYVTLIERKPKPSTPWTDNEDRLAAFLRAIDKQQKEKARKEA